MPKLRFSDKYAPLFDLPKEVRYVIMTGGRGSGKSFTLATSMVARTDAEKDWRVLYTRYAMTTADDSIIGEFEEKIELMAVKDRFDRLGKDFTNNQTGSELLFRGIKTSSGNQTAKLKSLQGINGWILEEAEELTDEGEFDKIDLSVRDPKRQNVVVLVLNPAHVSHWIYKRFFEDAGVESGFCGVVEDVLYIHTTYQDNPVGIEENPTFYAKADKLKKTNRPKWDHIWGGHWLQDMAGALWNWNMINDARVAPEDVPALDRIVVAVDPAVTSSKNSDETGIVVVAAGANGHYYVIEDATLKASPLGWAQEACRQYAKHGADRIIGEVNNGGDMIETTLRQVNREVPYRGVHASRGKIIRAEPIAALYEQGLVHHVGTFVDMETEQMTFTGSAKDASPNRLDAVVWGLAELSNGASYCVGTDDEDEHKDEPEAPQNADLDNEEAWE